MKKRFGSPQPSNENRLIRLLQKRSPVPTPVLKKGIGDDAAVILPQGAVEFWIVTTDMLVENIDFRREWMTPKQLGHKSIAANLSDLAAMGAKPRFFVVSLAVTRDISERWILDFQKGLTQGGSRLGAYLIGGDLSVEEGHIVVSICAIGESLNRKVLYRSGGKPGHILYVTGEPGRSAAGLKLLQEGKLNPGSKAQRTALRAHREPSPRCEVGVWLAQSGFVSCMMDLSDGISMDLPRLCHASGVGAEVDRLCLPVFSESAQWGCDPLDLALHGGEDYELLFAVSKSKFRLFESQYPASFPRITRIGRFTEDTGNVWLLEHEQRSRLEELGYDHFADRSKKSV